MVWLSIKPLVYNRARIVDALDSICSDLPIWHLKQALFLGKRSTRLDLRCHGREGGRRFVSLLLGGHLRASFETVGGMVFKLQKTCGEVVADLRTDRYGEVESPLKVLGLPPLQLAFDRQRSERIPFDLLRPEELDAVVRREFLSGDEGASQEQVHASEPEFFETSPDAESLQSEELQSFYILGEASPADADGLGAMAPGGALDAASRSVTGVADCFVVCWGEPARVEGDWCRFESGRRADGAMIFHFTGKTTSDGLLVTLKRASWRLELPSGEVVARGRTDPEGKAVIRFDPSRDGDRIDVGRELALRVFPSGVECMAVDCGAPEPVALQDEKRQVVTQADLLASSLGLTGASEENLTNPSKTFGQEGLEGA